MRFGCSDDGLSGPSGCVIDPQGVVDGRLGRFGSCRLAHVRGASVFAPEDGGDALLPFEDPAEGGPTVAVAGRAQVGADHLHELVGDDGDEQVALGPDGLAVVNGPQAEFGFGERKTASMSVGVMWVRHRAASFQSVWLVRRQYTPGWVTIDPCRGRREKRTATACCPGRVGVDGDDVVPGEPPASGLDPPDAFPDPVDPFPGAGPGKPLGEFGEGLLEAPGEAFDDGALLGRALLGEAVRARLPTVVGHDLLEMHVPVRRGADAYGVFGIEVPGVFAADDQVPIPLLAQPAHALLGGDAAVHHHQGTARGIEGIEHLRQGAVFAYVAGEHLGAAHEAAGVEHQPQGEQRAVGALVLGVSAPGLRLPPRPALEVGVGQIVRSNGPLQAEQSHRTVEEVAPDRLPVRHQGVGGAMQTHRPHRLEVRARQFAQGAAFAQPAPGCALRTGTRHARDDRADGGGAQRRADAQPFERIGQCGLLHGPRSDMLHPDRAGAEQFRGVDVDMLEIGPPIRRRGSGADAVPGEQRGGDAPGMRLQRRGDIGGQGHPAGEELVDASAEHRPLALRDIEVPPQVGQGALPHLVADTFGAHEAEGEVLAVGAGVGASDEHDGTVAGCRSRRKHKKYFMALHSLPRPRIKRLQAKIRENWRNRDESPANPGSRW